MWPTASIWYNENGTNSGVNGSVIPSSAGDACFGQLSVGFGSNCNPNLIGPELGFGVGMAGALGAEKFLVMKTAWGGKTLAGDFRPPRSTKGPDVFCQGDCDPSIVGHYYQVMIADARKMLAAGTVAAMFPSLAGLTPRIAGFGWVRLARRPPPPRHFIQRAPQTGSPQTRAHNANPRTPHTPRSSKAGTTAAISIVGGARGPRARAPTNTHPHAQTLNAHTPNQTETAAYETNMVNLVKDLRDEFGDPALPVSIAAAGFNGFDNAEATRFPKSDLPWVDMPPAQKVHTSCTIDNGCRRLDIVLSQLAAGNATRHPDLGGHVHTSETRGFWRDAQFSPNRAQGYHYWHNAETYYLVGRAMADGMVAAMQQ